MPLAGFTPQQTNDPLIQRIQADLQKSIGDIVRVLNALGPQLNPGTPTAPGGTVQLLALPQPGANGGIATLDGTGKLPAAQLTTLIASMIPDLSATYQIISAKDAANGYAGIDANARIALAKLPFEIGWVNFVDSAAPAITVNESKGTQVATIGYRTGTAAGDYTCTIPVALGSAFWALVGNASDTGTTQLVVQSNGSTILHSSTVLNFVVRTGANVLRRPLVECSLIWMGLRA